MVTIICVFVAVARYQLRRRVAIPSAATARWWNRYTRAVHAALRTRDAKRRLSPSATPRPGVVPADTARTVLYMTLRCVCMRPWAGPWCPGVGHRGQIIGAGGDGPGRRLGSRAIIHHAGAGSSTVARR